MAELTMVGQSKTFNYTGGVQTIELAPGSYQLEVWGASSGGWGNHVNAPGGYSRGVLAITETTTLYVVCGGKGKDAGHYSDGTGYNGGGLGNNGASSGGGATHIALHNGVLSSLEGHKDSVLMVAGGGGSNGWSGSFGIGGGLTGVGLIQKLYNGIVTYDNMHGTQTHGGTNGHPGSFGQGGGSTESCTGGGGGGWYGGSGSGGNVGMYPGGGGGSGYVNAALLTSASTHAGDETFRSPQGENELGHVGNGAAKITKVRSGNHSYTFCCTGDIQSITLSPGTYKLEAWGAEGGYAAYANANYAGGKGGYSAGIITLSEPTVLYIGVGGAGVGNSYGTSPGGFNGGGNGMCSNQAYAGTSGGGATHFALADGVLSSLASNQGSVLLVAGGGGGAGTNRYGAVSTGGHGGGFTGSNGAGSYSPGGGGTQTGGGASYNINGVSANTGASFGQGSSVTATNGNEGSGGGGGWYGGGSGGTSSGGGGGSGFANTMRLTQTNVLGGGGAFASPTGLTETGHSGSGIAKITPVSASSQNIFYGFSYTGNVQSVELTPGLYRIEAWGASGGDGASFDQTVGSHAGLGGYATGVLEVTQTTKYYIFVGGAGSSSSTTGTGGGYNGGGHGASGGYGGGGMTHISTTNNLAVAAINGGSWDPTGTILVAGGGGGADNAGGTNGGGDDGSGGYGGGVIAGNAMVDGIECLGDMHVATNANKSGCGRGGEQYAGYRQGVGECSPFNTDTGGGGAGWWGGFTTADNNGGGGGGSGYVNTALLSNAYMATGNMSFAAPTGNKETGHAGNGAVKIQKISSASLRAKREFFYTGAEQSVTLAPGVYRLECYGAQGGSSNGGRGGYAAGTITLQQETTFYVYVGGKGQYGTPFTETRPGGFNGGGASGTCDGANSYVTGNSSGGGASDIRIKSNSLYARVLVAGGGGGGFLGSYARVGGAGGGLSGGNGVDGCCRMGYGATQTGCPRNTATCGNGSAAAAGTFGQGSSGTYSYYTAGAGGGGGWYGGQASSSGCGGASAGGGSGYAYSANSAHNYPSGCLLNSSYYLEGVELRGGLQGGDGYVCITDVTPRHLVAGDSLRFDCLNRGQQIRLYPGVYQLEAWGAAGGQGADGTVSNMTWNYGKGGYSKGLLTLDRPTTLYVHVGGRGLGYDGSTHTGGIVAGGYNGGGNAYHDGGEFGGSGGGATHFALSDGVLSSLGSRIDDILLVAGGGGGSGEDNEAAGHGGSAITAPTGYYNVNSKGSFGQGSNYVNTGESGGGGGGGYYGGYGGQGGGSNGGTGYASSILTEVEGATGVNDGYGYALITAIEVNAISINKTKGIASVSSDPDVTENILPENTLVTITATVSPGYDFDRWDVHYDADSGVLYTSELSFEYLYTGSYTVAFTAYAIPHTNTPYVVNHYIMDSDGQTYVLHQTDELQGTTDTTAKADTLSLQYYVTPATQNVNINGDGTTVINYYYARQKFKLKVFEAVAGGKDTTLYNEDAYWGKPIFLSTTALPGYTFTAWMHDGTEYVYIESQNYPFEMPTQDLTLRPLFTPHDVEYIVHHKLLGDDLSTYETFETDHLQGLTDTNVTPSVKKYDYYDSPVTQTVKINGDGSTVVNYLYSRTVYALTLTADKGKNAMSAPSAMYMWGKSVSITVTTLAGYAFEQWLDADSKLQFANVATYTFLMPHRDLALHAVINPFEVRYTVQHNIQALEGGYQIKDIEEFYALTDTEVTPELKDYEGFSPTSSLETVNVNGDGSTLVNYYYERRGYTLIIKYSDEDIVEAHYFFQENVNLYFDNKARLEPLYAFQKWYTDTEGLTIKQPFMPSTSFLMPPRDGYVEAIIGENRKNTNIYKNIFPDEPFGMDVAYAYEQQLEKAIFDITQDNHGFAVGNVLCIVDGVYKKARAEDSPLGNPVGIVSKVVDENKFQLMKSGTMPFKEQSFTDTTILYLSNLVAGGLIHYKYITNKVYIPVAFYMDGRIIVNIQAGSIGADLAPYEEYENVSFEQYTEAELNDCVSIVLGGISE